jgi:hypothetical protein
MRLILSIICLTVVMSGCGYIAQEYIGGTNDSQKVATPLPSAESVELAVHMGSTQCMNDGTPLEEWVRQLTANGVEVRASSCGYTGNGYPAVCGGSDGRIAIVEVPSSLATTASNIGFFPLSSLPNAIKVACR